MARRKKGTEISYERGKQQNNRARELRRKTKDKQREKWGEEERREQGEGDEAAAWKDN